MATRKEKLSKIRLREKAQELGIRLHGFVTPNNWPKQHKHHFRAIRKIEDLRYEIYKKDHRIDLSQRHLCIERAREIRSKTYTWLEDVNINEDTWRSLESIIFSRFEGKVLWSAI